MSPHALGVYREPEFSPGKVDADAAILDAVVAELEREGFATASIPASRFAAGDAIASADIVLAMCQGEQALIRLNSLRAAGVVTVNSALAIRNCYRDLLGAGLCNAGVPSPPGIVVGTAGLVSSRELSGIDLSRGVFVKRGDLHALAPDDVQLARGLEELRRSLHDFASRGIGKAYLQQEVIGSVVKFYGVSGDEFFAVLPEQGWLPDRIKRTLAAAASDAARALGLDVWGGDAIVSGDAFQIVDFNDWPSFGAVRGAAAPAIARRCIRLLRQAA